MPSGLSTSKKKSVTSAPERALSLLKAEMEHWRVALFGDRLHVIVNGDPEKEMRALGARLEQSGVRVLETRDQDYSLEDVFLVIVEKSQRAQKAAAA